MLSMPPRDAAVICQPKQFALGKSAASGHLGAAVPDQIQANYRLYGDQVSLIGVPIGTTTTLPYPSVGSNGGPTGPLDFLGMFNAHVIKNMIPVIQSNYSNLNNLPSPAQCLRRERSILLRCLRTCLSDQRLDLASTSFLSQSCAGVALRD